MNQHTTPPSTALARDLRLQLQTCLHLDARIQAIKTSAELDALIDQFSLATDRALGAFKALQDRGEIEHDDAFLALLKSEGLPE